MTTSKDAIIVYLLDPKPGVHKVDVVCGAQYRSFSAAQGQIRLFFKADTEEMKHDQTEVVEFHIHETGDEFVECGEFCGTAVLDGVIELHIYRQLYVRDFLPGGFHSNEIAPSQHPPLPNIPVSLEELIRKG